MSEPNLKYEDSQFCIIACWGVAALGGLAAAVLFGGPLGWGLIGGIFVGGIVFVLAGFLLSLFLCGRLIPMGQATPLVYDEHGVVVNEGALTAERAPAPTPSAAPVAAAPVPAAEIKPSAALAGQADLAERKGEWSYQGDSAEQAPAAEGDFDKDGVVEGESEGTKPATLESARDGKPDDLKQIKGIGPKLEQLCFKLGFYHFDQIAAWTGDEVAWVDANLEGFKGRVSRDQWVEQAKVLAQGGETEFSKRVEEGDVY